MEHRDLYSITESQKLLGGISPNGIYASRSQAVIPAKLPAHSRHGNGIISL